MSDDCRLNRSGKVALLLGRIHVGSQHPLFLGVGLLHSAKHYLVRLHLKSGAKLLGFNLVELWLAVEVVAEADEVIPV